MLTWVALGLLEKRTAKEARDSEARNNKTLEKNHFVGGCLWIDGSTTLGIRPIKIFTLFNVVALGIVTIAQDQST
tara:strand:- start:191 stop:415 length:225 start_codon:yes stop_codon:yes gene_type:complete